MTGTVVGVLRGGPSQEHDVSLKTGATMLAHLPSDRFVARDIYIDKQGQWHDRGRAVDPVRALQGVDAVLVGLHGEYGEDGQVQRLLELQGIPFTGANSFSSFMAMHKALAKHKAQEAGLKTPRGVLIENRSQIISGVKEAMQFMQPVIVKPVRWGSSVGITIAHGFQPVFDAVDTLIDQGAGGVLVEELIKGTEATVGVVENLRSERLYALPVIEIVPPPRDFFSYDAKYSGESQEIVPGRFPRSVAEELSRAAKLMHDALGVRHYSRSDFIVSPKGVYYLETNTLPGMTPESLMPKSLGAVGITLPEFLTHLVDLSIHHG
ncbi:MAG TPA: D-alanine--D-alanine ligase [Candidatus Paceibacterota bacterium]|nr:D-alanine--D-alanine ligase [Candidatus Paceibacterota bacterium]